MASPMDFRDSTFDDFNRPKIGHLPQFKARALHWRANRFGGNGAPK